MKHYFLKDSDYQNVLDNTVAGTDSFDEALQEAIASQRERFEAGQTVMVNFGHDSTQIKTLGPLPLFALKGYMLLITKDDVESEEVYSARDWNDYPAITPPEGEYMRLEWQSVNKRGISVCEGVRAYYQGGKWFDAKGVELYNGDGFVGMRFRPWDEKWDPIESPLEALFPLSGQTTETEDLPCEEPEDV